MPPRTPSGLSSNALNLTSLLQALPSSKRSDAFTKCSTCLFSTSHRSAGASRNKRPLVQKDPYRAAQVAQRKTANLEKRRVLAAEREAAMGDPIRSKPTPFLQSLDLYQPNASADNQYLNYQLDPKAKADQLSHSQWLTEPLSSAADSDIKPDEKTIERYNEEVQKHQEGHQNATRAIDAITSLNNASSKDKTRINVQRCIETFGRHTTDLKLPPKPASLGSTSSLDSSSLLDNTLAPTPEQTRRAELLSELASIPKRAGPDTGSSEVQIAILTTKINVLANNLHNKDKTNKRSLRLLVHRRQKLLKYLRRKERGGPRWQNLVAELGINDGMWKGEIAL